MDPKTVWDSKAQYYKDSFEDITFPAALTLANMLELSKSKDVIEVACATGKFSVFCLSNYPNIQNFTSCDISDSMIELAKQRKAEALGIHKSINHEFKAGNAEDLKDVKDESIDTYISNLCINLVPDASIFLQEAKRVLKKGGRVGLSVPKGGEGYMHTIFEFFAEAGFKMLPGRSPYYLGSREAMIKLLQDNGFEVEACWDDHYKCPYYTDESIVEVLSGKDFGPIYLKFDQEAQASIKEKILSKFRKVRESFEPLQVGGVSIVARKPL